jgi:hypothetical protein
MSVIALLSKYYEYLSLSLLFLVRVAAAKASSHNPMVASLIFPMLTLSLSKNLAVKFVVIILHYLLTNYVIGEFD